MRPLSFPTAKRIISTTGTSLWRYPPRIHILWAASSVIHSIGYLISEHVSLSIEKQQDLLSTELPPPYQTLRKLTTTNLVASFNRLGIPPTQSITLVFASVDCFPLNLPAITRLLSKLATLSCEIVIADQNLRFRPADNLDLIQFMVAIPRATKAVAGYEAPNGRPPKFTPEMIEEIERLRSDPANTATSIAKQLGIGRSTLYTYLSRLKDMSSPD